MEKRSALYMAFSGTSRHPGCRSFMTNPRLPSELTSSFIRSTSVQSTHKARPSFLGPNGSYFTIFNRYLVVKKSRITTSFPTAYSSLRKRTLALLRKLGRRCTQLKELARWFAS